jgi:hypothetical protein
MREFSCALSDHDYRRIGVAVHKDRDHRGIRHAKAGHAMHAQQDAQPVLRQTGCNHAACRATAHDVIELRGASHGRSQLSWLAGARSSTFLD